MSAGSSPTRTPQIGVRVIATTHRIVTSNGWVAPIATEYADGRQVVTAYSPWVVCGVPGCSRLPSYPSANDALAALHRLNWRGQA